jgi:hypothetical protein
MQDSLTRIFVYRQMFQSIKLTMSGPATTELFRERIARKFHLRILIAEEF